MLHVFFKHFLKKKFEPSRGYPLEASFSFFLMFFFFSFSCSCSFSFPDLHRRLSSSSQRLSCWLSVGYRLVISDDQVESRSWWAAGGSSHTFVAESPDECARAVMGVTPLSCLFSLLSFARGSRSRPGGSPNSLWNNEHSGKAVWPRENHTFEGGSTFFHFLSFSFIFLPVCGSISNVDHTRIMQQSSSQRVGGLSLIPSCLRISGHPSGSRQGHHRYTGTRSAGRPWVARTQFSTAVQCRNTANMVAVRWQQEHC